MNDEKTKSTKLSDSEAMNILITNTSLIYILHLFEQSLKQICLEQNALCKTLYINNNSIDEEHYITRATQAYDPEHHKILKKLGLVSVGELPSSDRIFDLLVEYFQKHKENTQILE